MDGVDRGYTILTTDEYYMEALRTLGLQKRKRGNQGTRDRRRYKDIVTAFDIETTNIPGTEQAVMYVWQWAFGEQTVVMGRTWDEFLDLVDRIVRVLNEDEYIVVFVHNLSFEFQFLSGVYDFNAEDVFAIGPRKVLKAEMFKHIEFRCSYIQSNMSLAKFTEKMGVKHQKLSGDEFDYDKVRYSWTPLSDRELEYCCNDVVGLVEAINTEIRNDNESLHSLPLTSTGYVRRDTKRAMEGVNHYWMRKIQPTWIIYEMLREAFRGGNTHANRYFSGRLLERVGSEDMSSAYPYQLTKEYPVRPFFYYGPATMKQLEDMINRRHKAVVMRVKIWNIRLIDDGWGCPYLSKDKCRRIVKGAYDNGRVLSADYLETTLTDIDFKIVISEYSFDHMEPYEVAHSTYGPLPEAFVKLVYSYYEAKTKLKGVEGQEYFYAKSKNLLNSLYGMCAQNPVRITEIFGKDPARASEEGYHGEWIFPRFTPDPETDPDDLWKPFLMPEELLEKNSKRAFLPYQWGVWCTAHGRMALEEGIRAAGDWFVYCDTDSVKYKLDEGVDFTDLNAKIQDRAESVGAFADDPQGERHYMGVYEHDATYERFITLGAKKYAYEEISKKTKKLELHITVAGVGKEKGAVELAENGGLEAFKPGFVFRAAGGTEVTYNDEPPLDPVTIDGHEVRITRNVHIGPSEYTLGVTDEYRMLLSDIQLMQKRGLDRIPPFVVL